MTTWTTPRTWGTGDLVTAADLNEQLRDNLAYLKTAITFDIVAADNDYTSNAIASFVEVDNNNLVLTVSTRGKLALVGFEAALRQSSATQGICLDVSVDGSRLGTTNRGLVYHQMSNARDAIVATAVQGQHWLTNLSAGTHTLKLMWRQIESTAVTGYIDGTASGGLPTRLWLLEFDI